MENKNIDNTNIADFEYTVVLDGSYKEPLMDAIEENNQVVERAVKDDPKKAMDRLYQAYEKMCLKEPTILDLNDAYPHTYQWRIGDRYDPAREDMLKEAIEKGIKIADTEAYQEYAEEVRTRKFAPVSWD